MCSFFLYDTSTTEIYTLSLHDALPILLLDSKCVFSDLDEIERVGAALTRLRSEEHTSELQSQSNLVCRLLLEKKNSQLSFLSGQIDQNSCSAGIPRPISYACFSSTLKK